MRTLCLSSKFPHQEIRWNFCILRSLRDPLKFSKLLLLTGNHMCCSLWDYNTGFFLWIMRIIKNAYFEEHLWTEIKNQIVSDISRLISSKSSHLLGFWKFLVMLALLNFYFYLKKNIIFKQPLRGVLEKRCSKNMQQIYRRTPMPKRDFNKVALQL